MVSREEIDQVKIREVEIKDINNHLHSSNNMMTEHNAHIARGNLARLLLKGIFHIAKLKLWMLIKELAIREEVLIWDLKVVDLEDEDCF